MVRSSWSQMRWLPIREDFLVHFDVHSHQSRRPVAPRSKAAEQVDLKEARKCFNDQSNERDPFNPAGMGDFGDFVMMSC